MASIKGLSDLSNEIAKALTEYTEDVTKGIEKEKRINAKKAVEMLKAASPKSESATSGEYANSWTTSKIDGKQVIYNKEHYQLTHLLEYGHANRDGGRTPGKPHIRPVEEFISDRFIEGVKKVIGK
ncbi:HK97 gp10 family phage protein [Clostridium beijerinckii]|uniref:HK97 gp10 family phage protein n=1 Tax=Clostridium beijerinckii TaxID=1520 RepID=UPI00232EFE53|nr:HK97 gp10 family phage protein [Clostridium beijerinckii]